MNTCLRILAQIPRPAPALALCLSAACLAPARAQTVVLTINVTDPSAVVITATGAFATADDSSQDSGSGIELLGLFTASTGLGPSGSLSGNLSGGGATAYNQWGSDNLSSGTDYTGLNLFFNLGSSSDPQAFSTGAAAFTGSATGDLSSVAALLPAAGSTGDVQAGWSLSPGAVIGQYIVVPEPEEWLFLVAAGLAPWGIGRRCIVWRVRQRISACR